ncbi:EAL domain-containing protein [Thaumasiovibrio sp. DFM-14]|uniref:EAL domain-containing protein n=1 Tax=Thaumasiovibrio sp. DFM-14 TaxID=3384792 RepID=UPI00399F023E
MNKRLGLQRKYIIVNAVIVFVVIAVLSSVYLFFLDINQNRVVSYSNSQVTSSLIKQLEVRGGVVTDYLADLMVNPLYQYDYEEARQLIKPVLLNNEVLSVYIYNREGIIFHNGDKYLNSFGRLFPNENELTSVLKKGVAYRNVTPYYIDIAKPIYMHNEILGGVSIRLSLAGIKKEIDAVYQVITEANDDVFKRISSITVALALTSFGVGVLLSVFVSTRVVKPIRDLVAHTKRISRGDFNITNGNRTDDELGELANAFMDMGSNLESRNKEIAFLAYHDSLTKLPNRAYFIDHVNNCIDNNLIEAIGFTVLFVDLDEFKHINDNYGHESGDYLLCEISERISMQLKVEKELNCPFDVSVSQEVVARIGGDEFLIYIPFVTRRESTSAIAKRVVNIVKTSVLIEGDDVAIGASIGIASYPEDGRTASELIKNADIAMYQAKRKGKNTYSHFNESLHEGLRLKMDLERDLRRATSEHCQFEIWYQPQFDITSNLIVGAEALIRWHHPTKGYIYPQDFISIAEDTGLILQIGEWIIDSVCRQVGLWLKNLPPGFHVAINLSAKQMYRQNVAEVFFRLLHQYRVPPQFIHVEVTESLLMKDEMMAEKTLQSLRQLGLKLWLDDFGTGYSSLDYLRRFHFDGVKIDRSFIANIEHDKYDRALTSAVIDLAGNINMDVVAEGVETEYHINFLRQKKCNIVQGYYYSKPVPASEFEQCYLQLNPSKKATDEDNKTVTPFVRSGSAS